MKWIQRQLKILEDLMEVASKKRLWADRSKIETKYKIVKKHMRCLNIAELRELMQLELL